MDKLKIATRGSPLALWQAEHIRTRLRERLPDLDVELVLYKTKGDKILDTALAQVGGKGLFVKELEDALLRGDADLAVHSMKDVPVDLPDGLTLGAFSEREDPRDALVSSYARSLEELRQGARVGTSSLRRRAQVLEKRPDLEVITLRGNVGTRVDRMGVLYLDAVILASAGLKRLGMGHRIACFFSEDEMLPAIGQGVLGIEIREGDREVRDLISFLNHRETEVTLRAERAFLRRLEGGCQVPIGARAVLDDGMVRLTGMVGDLNGDPVIRETDARSPEQAEELGETLADRILERGGREILDRLYSQG